MTYTRSKYKQLTTNTVSNNIDTKQLYSIKEIKIGNNTKTPYDLEKIIFKEIGILYFISDIHNTYIRIGKTKNLANLHERYRKHQSGSPLQLYLVGIQVSDQYHKLDKQLQQQFSIYRLHSDWYRYVLEIQDYIKLNCLKLQYSNSFYPDAHIDLEKVF